ncbi:heparan-alpha-glucosaminide N-acetyltransferase domain-containing protein [Chryseolinea sp. T2]|uniref:DUF1624 domain-containing protein n=1 Tax=Chryseolinea sp. T2 TaxID=3129255 RepID=UPI003077704F
MSTETQPRTERLRSIDITRGLVIIIMALDHVRDFFSYTAYRATDVTQASVLLFGTRWITHICAPTFVFLSGISVYLYYRKVSDRKRTSIFLLKRGLWLIVVDVAVISFVLTQGYQLTLLEVIWAIGCSMIFLAALIWLPRWLQALVAIVMIAGHNALAPIGEVTSENMILALLHNSPFFVADPPILVAYTIIPWVGVMLLGYVTGIWFTYPLKQSEKYLLAAGISAIAIFIMMRAINMYGDPSPWEVQERGNIFTFLSFLNVTKSPPSLLFLSLTLGISCLILVSVNHISSRLQNILLTYGKVPLFFFIVHLAIISGVAYLWTRIAFGRAVNLSFTKASDWPTEYHPSLIRTYLIWILLIIILYLPCHWFGKWKSNSDSWWSSYL